MTAVSYGSDAQLGVFASHVNGSEVKICPMDDYTLIFECQAVGDTCHWTLDPIIGTQSPIFLSSQPAGTVIMRNSVTVVLKDKTIEASDFIFESLLYVPAKVVIAQQSFPVVVVCKGNDVQDAISITPLSM